MGKFHSDKRTLGANSGEALRAMRQTLHRYWFKFAEGESPSILNMGCGITAYDEADAREILGDEVFAVFGSRDIIEVIADVDIRTLEENHVRPDMGVPVWRGVWYPNLQSAGPIR